MELGFIGLGQMEFPMAHRLIEAEHHLNVFNRSLDPILKLEKMGAERRGNPLDVAAKAEIIISCLPDSHSVKQVYLEPKGLLDGSTEGKILVETGTISPTLIKKIDEIAKTKNVFMMDAGILGGPAGAENGSLIFMVGGDGRAFNQIQPILKILGDKIFYMGYSGNGMMAKLVNNLLAHVNATVIMEGFALATKYGLAPKRLFEVVQNSSGNSRVLKRFESYIMSGFFKPGMSFDLFYKDSFLVCELGRELGIPMFVSNAAHVLYEWGRSSGLKKENWEMLITLWENLLKVQIGEKEKG